MILPWHTSSEVIFVTESNKFMKIINNEPVNVVESVVSPNVNITSIDPRPDLAKDSIIWQQVLSVAETMDYKLYGALRVMRAAGTQLMRTNDGGLRLYPYIDESAGVGRKDVWVSMEQYNREKGEILDTVKDLLVGLFGKFSKAAA
jgi:hypothetical protein